jgi:acyl-CoA thioester hydrolase
MTSLAGERSCLKLTPHANAALWQPIQLKDSAASTSNEEEGMKTNPGEGVVDGADSAERIHRNQPSQSQTGDSYRKSFEIRLDEIDFNGHLHNTKYLEYCSHTRYCQLVEQGWDLRRMGEYGIGAVSLADDIHYRREVQLGDLITVTYQVTGYSADGKRWRSRTQMLRPDGAVAATVTTNGAWFGLRSRRIEAPRPELVAATDSIKSEDFAVLESLHTAAVTPALPPPD